MKRFRYLALLLLGAYLLTGVYQIRPEERAVVRRLGRVVAKPGPGLWVGLPWALKMPLGQKKNDKGSERLSFRGLTRIAFQKSSSLISMRLYPSNKN